MRFSLQILNVYALEFYVKMEFLYQIGRLRQTVTFNAVKEKTIR